MAQRRMFSLKIVDTDAFLDMPQSGQLLYFHLSMRADDDGFVGNPKKIMRMIGAGEDDYKILLVKRFVIPFDNGVCVIKHWKIHNYIQNDRYTPTTYIEERSKLFLKENGSYTDKEKDDVSKVYPQVRIGKVREGKDNTSVSFDSFWDIYPKKVGKVVAEKSFARLNPSKELLDTILKDIEERMEDESWQKEGGRFILNPATYLNQRRWEDETEDDKDIELPEYYKKFKAEKDGKNK